MRETPPVLRVENVAKGFARPARSSATEVNPDLHVLRGVSFDVHAGEMIAVVGESGSGKSSLLHLLARLDRPDHGSIQFGSEEITKLTPEAAARLRNRQIGYVWQFHYLLPEFTAVENVALPLLARGLRRKEALGQASLWLSKVGLQGRDEHRSGELSGGEQQRVAIARALVTEPRLLLADEPTGDLDTNTAERVFALLQRLTGEHGLATVMVTHNLTFARRCDRVLQLEAGAFVPI